MNTWLEDLLEEATKDAELRRALLEDPERTVAEKGYETSQEELEFLRGLRDQLATTVAASFGCLSSEQLAAAGVTPSAIRFAASQAQQAASQAAALGLSQSAQQFAAVTAARPWVQAAASQAAARRNVGEVGRLQFAAKQNSTAK